jgi:hypothetical protein
MRRLGTSQSLLTLYAGPATSYPVVGSVGADQTVTAIARSSDQHWYQLITPAGTGWAVETGVVLHCVLIADLYPFDNEHPSWTEAQTSPLLGGAILKATQGKRYGYTKWFIDNWGPLRTTAGARYGDTWFRGAYHFYGFYDAAGTPEEQADFFLKTVDSAGGWDTGDLAPVVDVELGGDNASAAAGLSASQIVDQIGRYTAVIKRALGCPVMLYGGSAMRDKGITDHMGCDFVWTAQLAAALSPQTHERAGWTDAGTVLWQYTDGQVNHTSFPTKLSGLGGDLSVYRPNDLGVLATQLTWYRPARPA